MMTATIVAPLDNPASCLTKAHPAQQHKDVYHTFHVHVLFPSLDFPLYVRSPSLVRDPIPPHTKHPDFPPEVLVTEYRWDDSVIATRPLFFT